MRTTVIACLIAFTFLSYATKAQTPVTSTPMDAATYDARLLELVENDITSYKGEPDTSAKSEVPGQTIHLSKAIFPEFEFATYFDNVLVSEGGGWKGTNSQTLSFQTNAPNTFLHNAIARLIETGLPGYIKDANLVLSMANGKRFTLGVGFYNREQTNFMSMIEYPDGSVRLTVMQNKYYNARDYSSKKIGYTRTTAYQDWIITPQFDAVELAGFHDGLALVNLGGKPTKGKNLGGYTDYVKGGKFAFINRKGEIVIPWTKCDHAGGFRNGKAWFETKGIYTYIDKTGKVIKGQ